MLCYRFFMNPGRELDVLIAKKVMGLVHPISIFKDEATYQFGPRPQDWTHLPKYSEDIAAAWQVVEKLDAGAVSEFSLNRDYEGPWHCYFSWANEGESCKGECHNGTSAQHAICLAALRALGITP